MVNILMSNEESANFQADIQNGDDRIYKVYFTNQEASSNCDSPALHPSLLLNQFSNKPETPAEEARYIPKSTRISELRLLLGHSQSPIHSEHDCVFLLDFNVWMDICNSTDDEVVSPIDNCSLLANPERSNLSGCSFTETAVIPDMRCLAASLFLESGSRGPSEAPAVQCVWLNAEAWRYLRAVAGGGPEVSVSRCWLKQRTVDGSNRCKLQLSLAPTTSLGTAKNAIVKGALAVAEVHVCVVCLSVGVDMWLGSGAKAQSRCSRCQGPRYCSRECQLAHWPFHKLQCKPQVASLALSGGCRVGLRNIGNSCYLSSCLQALSHCAPLTRLLLSGRFEADVNESNPDGSGGAALLREYTSMLKELWLGSQSSIAPTTLKRVLGRINQDYAGFGQHDAHDVLELIFDRLHEDLNRVRVKPYVPSPEGDGSDDAAVADEAWRGHLRRHDSVLTQLFGGQLRSRLHCPSCGRIAVSFDFAQTLLLAFPAPPPPPVKIDVLLLPFVCGHKVMSLKSDEEVTTFPPVPANISLCLVPPSDTNVLSTSKKWITGERVRIALAASLECSPTAVRLFVQSAVDRSLVAPVTDKTLVSKFARSLDCEASASNVLRLVAFVVDADDAVSPDTVPTGRGSSHTRDLTVCLQQSVWSEEEEGDCRIVGSATIVRLPCGASCSSVRLLMCRILFRDPELRHSLGLDRDADEVLRALSLALPLCKTDRKGKSIGSKDSSMNLCADDVDDSSVRRASHPLLSLVSSVLHDQTHDQSNSNTELVPTSVDCSIGAFLGDAEEESWDSRTLTFMWNVKWARQEGVRTFLSTVLEAYRERAFFEQRPFSAPEETLSLTRCLQHFTKEEVLEEAEAWFCSRCQKHVRAKKQLAFWRLPEILVIGLKRFEFRDGMGMGDLGSGFGLGSALGPGFRQKLTDLVDFPVDGLDLRQFLSAAAQATVTRTSYDLVAVINHYGRMGFGHYTAMARDWGVDGKLADQWLLFDDDSVEAMRGGEDVVTAAAYMLFYRRRN